MLCTHTSLESCLSVPSILSSHFEILRIPTIQVMYIGPVCRSRVAGMTGTQFRMGMKSRLLVSVVNAVRTSFGH